MDKKVKSLIKLLSLSRHPEGGYYRETFRSKIKIKSPRNKETRNVATNIYFLLPAGEASRFHMVLHDEIWHFYEGSPLELIEASPDGLSISKTLLGKNKNNTRYNHCVKGGNWQAAYSTGNYSLLGCTVAPGFSFDDFRFLRNEQETRAAIIGKQPGLINLL